MNAVRENPYRTLGLFGNATEKELQRQIATIKRFAEVGKSKSFDYDFPFLGDFNRGQETVTSAANKIEQSKNKVHYSLFWFLNTNHIDETALNHLKEANIEKATEIWTKLLRDNTITVKNYSAALNLSTLQLGIITLNGSFNQAQFKECVELKGQLIASDAFINFVQTVSGNNSVSDRNNILKEFVDEVLQILKPYLNKSNGITSIQLIENFNSFPTEIKQYVSNKFTDRPLSNIENQIEKAKLKRESIPQNAGEYGEELFKIAKEDLLFLKGVWNINSVKYQLIANKLANEIMQCAIEYYNFHLNNDKNVDPGNKALQIAKYSMSIGPTGHVKQRIEENTKPIQDWVNNKPYRERQNTVNIEYKNIVKELKRFHNQIDSISGAVNLVNYCKPFLNEIKLKLGENDSIYLELSTAVVSNAQGMIICVVNEAMEKRNKYVEFQNALRRPYSYNNSYNLLEGLKIQPYSLEDLKYVIKEAWNATKSLGTFDMLPNQRNSYNQNRDTLKSIAEQLNIPLSLGQSTTGGCYIATMAYGSYEHPQVLHLRRLRDEILMILPKIRTDS